ncbi:MAG: hypothetical protein AAF559_05770 [Pseudomonadota bacterium]
MLNLFRTKKPRWIPPYSLSGLFRRTELRRKVQEIRNLALDWRWASANDWPRMHFIGDDFRFARRHGFGFVAEVGSERLYLVPRGFDDPEWGLAAYLIDGEQWCALGYIEPRPGHWRFPEPHQK